MSNHNCSSEGRSPHGSHPFRGLEPSDVVGAFYGGLVSLVLILPSTQGHLTCCLVAGLEPSILGVVAFTATCGLASHITNARPGRR